MDETVADGPLLAVRPDNLGDLVLCSPALRSLKTTFPDAELTLLTSPLAAPLAPLLPWVDRTISRRLLWQDPYRLLPFDPSREAAFVQELADGRFAAAFLFTGPRQTPYPAAYACYLAGIPVRVGSSTEFGGAVLSHPVPGADGPLHEADHDLRLLESVGVPAAGRHLELVVPDRAVEQLALRLAALSIDEDERLIVVAPGAHAPARRYPIDRFERLVRLLAPMGRVLVVGGSDEAPWSEAFGSAAALLARTTIPELAALLARADVLVANNSGPMHMAEALGCPSVVLFAGTDDPAWWAPRFTPVRILSRATACSPCARFTCPTELECLAIAPETVAHAVGDLAGWSVRPAGEDLVVRMSGR